MKYEINEKCPISEKVTFSSNVRLTSDRLHCHLFQFGWMNKNNRRCSSGAAGRRRCCTSFRFWCVCYMNMNKSWEMPQNLIRRSSRAVLASTNAGKLLGSLSHLERIRTILTTITTRAFITYPQGNKKFNSGVKTWICKTSGLWGRCWRLSFTLFSWCLFENQLRWWFSEVKFSDKNSKANTRSHDNVVGNVWTY